MFTMVVAPSTSPAPLARNVPPRMSTSEVPWQLPEISSTPSSTAVVPV